MRPLVVTEPGGGTHVVHALAPVSLGWLAMLLAAAAAGSALLLWLAWRLYFHLSGDFAEEL